MVYARAVDRGALSTSAQDMTKICAPSIGAYLAT